MKPQPGNAEPQLGIQPAPRRYTRGYLPHYDSSFIYQFITFRLSDSLPQTKLRELEQDLRVYPVDRQDVERRKQIEAWLDAGMGCCALRHPQMAAVMADTLRKFDGDRYQLCAWCVMPNHVHGLIRPEAPLAKIIQSWKSYTGRWALAHNAELGLGVPGKAFWMREYWDRSIRDDQHYRSVVEYIHNNPVKAGLCEQREDWKWSSANRK